MKTKLCTACFLLAAAAMTQTPATPKARVLVYERFRIRTIRANPLFCDGVQVANLREKSSYFVLEVTPGEHSFRGKRKTDSVIIDAVAGRDYFLEFQGDIFNRFVRRTTEEGQEAIALIKSGKLQPIDPGDVMDRKQVSLSFNGGQQ